MQISTKQYKNYSKVDVAQWLAKNEELRIRIQAGTNEF